MLGKRALLLVTVGTLVVQAAASVEANHEPDHVGILWLGAEGQTLPFSNHDEVLEFLKTARVTSQEDIPMGVTKPKKLLLEKDGVSAHAVFRYVDKMEERVWLSDGSFVPILRDSYLNEVAAYELARLLGVDNVPPVVRRTLRKGGAGSVQLWIENAMLGADRKELDMGLQTPHEQHRLHDMNVFDNVINNIDRNLKNFLVSADGEIWLIDHTRSFARDHELIKPDRILKVSEPLWKGLAEVGEAEIEACLQPFMGAFEIKAVLERRARVVEILKDRIQEQGRDQVVFSYSRTAEQQVESH